MDNQYNNGFGFNNQNGYDNNQYNQYNQQPGQQQPYQQMPQQPMQQQQQMYNPNMQQPMMYNQYPNQYDPNAGMYPQPLITKSNRGGGIFGVILAILLVAGLTIFLLDYTGKIDVKSLINKDKTEEKQSTEKPVEEKKEEEKKEEEKPAVTTEKDELANMCTLVGEDGFYNKELIQSLSEKTNNLPDSATMDEVWDVVKGAKYCQANSCFIYENSNSHIIHGYNCSTKEYYKSSLDDILNSANAEIILNEACGSLDANGSLVINDQNSYLNGVEGLKCQSFVCTVIYEGKDYIKKCQE